MCKGCALCKVKPKDAASNLSYMFAHAVYGVVATAIIAKVGDPMLFDAKSVNDYLEPTELTTEQKSHLAQKHQEQWQASRAEDNGLIRRH